MYLVFLFLLSLIPAFGGYAFDRTITLDHTTIPNTDLTNFTSNFFSTNADTLNGAINNSTTTITLTNGKQVQSGDYIRIDTEILGPCTGSGVNWTCARAALSSTAASHIDKQIVTDTFLGSAANGGGVINGPNDIVFGTNLGCTTRIAWIPLAYSVLGPTSFRFRLTRSHTVDDVIHVCYGNAAISTPQYTASDICSNSTVSMWNFGDGTTLDLTDVCGTNNGTSSPSFTASTSVMATSTTIHPTDGGSTFNGFGGRYIDVGSSASLALTTLTIEAWVIVTDGSNPYMVFSRDDGVNHGYALFAGQGIMSFIYADGTNLAIPRVTNTGACLPGTSDCLMAVTITGNTVLMYFNGVSHPFTNVGAAATGILNTSGPAEIGARPTGAFAMSGNIDDLRISSVVRSADWLLATFNMESSPYTAYTLSAPVAIPSGVKHKLI